MNFLFPFAAALLQATSATLDKVVLSMKRVDFKNYNGIGYPLAFFVILPVFLILRPPLSINLFFGNAWLLIILSIGMSITMNLLFYRALDHDYLSEMQSLDLLRSIPIILFSSLIFTDERNFGVLVPAIIAACAVVWSHWEHHKIQMRKYTRSFFLWAFLTAPIAAAIFKVLLRTWNPISLELVHWGVTGVILGTFFFKSAKKVSKKEFFLIFITTAISVAAWILYYYSYQRSGIVYTVLLFSLQPFLVYLASLFFLKEKFHPKKAIAFGVVLLSIVAAQMLR